MTKFKYISIAIILLLAIGLAACNEATTPSTSTTTQATTTGTTGDVLKVGFVSTMTGPGAMWGEPYWNGAQIQAQMINDAGGIKVGNKAYKLQLVLEDDKLSPEAGITAINKLVFQEKLDYILSGWAVNATSAFASILNDNKIISFSTAPAYAIGPKDEWIWIVADNDLWKVTAVAMHVAKQNPTFSNVALLVPDNTNGANLSDSFKSIIMPQYVNNWKIVDEVKFQDGTKDFTSIIARILLKKPDVIYNAGSIPGEYALMVKQAREAGFKGPIIYCAAIDADIFTGIIGPENMYGQFFPFYDYAITPEAKALNDAYKAKYGAYSSLVPYSCDQLYILKQALEQAGTLDKNSVKKVLETGTFKSLQGEGKFTGTKTFGINHQWARVLAVGSFDDKGQNITVGKVLPSDLLKLAGEQ